ncbi:MAG: hypothetical protein H7249_06695 [Chitinophagaceae bacterium]|nr:hypothetical protein [Oligoflexus sp.]
MIAFYPRIFIGLSLSAALMACGANTANYRSPGLVAGASSEADAKVEATRANVAFLIPDRADAPDSEPTMNGYYYGFKGTGTNCPANELFEELGSYVDTKPVTVRLSSLCTYSVTMKLGVLAPGATLGLAAPAAAAIPISFDGQIKDIVAKNCVSCHEGYANYKELVSHGDIIIQRLEAGTMPQAAPLPDSEIAVFLAWKDAGYLEKDPTPLPTAKESGLETVYYKNNNNDLLMDYELLGRSKTEIRRSLWLQPDGVKLGLKVDELKNYVLPHTTSPAPTP